MFRSICLILLPYFCFASDTKFIFNGHFKCQLADGSSTPWCVKQTILRVGEKLDTYLVGPKKECSTEKYVNLELNKIIKDRGDDNREYEFMAVLHHNCSDHGQIWLYEKNIGNFEVKNNAESFDVNYIIDITNQRVAFGSLDDIYPEGVF